MICFRGLTFQDSTLLLYYAKASLFPISKKNYIYIYTYRHTYKFMPIIVYQIYYDIYLRTFWNKY